MDKAAAAALTMEGCEGCFWSIIIRVEVSLRGYHKAGLQATSTDVCGKEVEIDDWIGGSFCRIALSAGAYSHG